MKGESNNTERLWRLSVFLHFFAFCLILVFKNLTSASANNFGMNWKNCISAGL